jgi:tRNA nucleotidyltransferase/poly(A) polymerase
MTTLSTHDVRAYLVGGAVRDRIRGIPSHDWDFAVEARDYDHMDRWIQDLGFRVFVRTPKTFTIRARCEDSVSFAGIQMEHQTYDFVLCRKDGVYTDGRRPDSVTAGTLYDDLARRDFTCNAIALAEDGTYVDPHNGQKAIEEKVLRLVGGRERLVEDGLRVIRALRFYVTTGFTFDAKLRVALRSDEAAEALSKVSANRIRDELNKMLKHSLFDSIDVLAEFPDVIEIIEDKGVWLKATSETR